MAHSGHTHTDDIEEQPWGVVLFGGFLTVVIGLSLTLLGLVFVNTLSAGHLPLTAVSATGIALALFLYYVGLETVFLEFAT